MLHICVNTCLRRIYTDFDSKVDTSRGENVRYRCANELLGTRLFTGTSSLIFLAAVGRIVAVRDAKYRKRRLFTCVGAELFPNQIDVFSRSPMSSHRGQAAQWSYF